MRAVLTAVLVALAASPAAAARGSISEALTAGSGPFVGNSISAGFSPDRFDLDVGYDFGSDQDLVLYHSIWGSLGVWPIDGLQISFDGSFDPRVTSNTADRGHFALSGAGGGVSLAYHPGRSGDVRPYLQIGGGVSHVDVEQSTSPRSTDVVSAGFDQTSARATLGFDSGDTSVRAGASKFFYSSDPSAVDLPPGAGFGPLGLGAGQGALPTRAQDWSLRASLRQRFGAQRSWDALVRVTYAPYVNGRGSIQAVNLRLGHDLTREVRGYVGMTTQLEDLTDAGRDRSEAGVFGTAGLSLLF